MWIYVYNMFACVSSIDQLTELVRKHIENAVQIHHELVLQSDDFCVDGDTRVVASPASAPRRSLQEQPKNSTLTVQQLHVLCAQLSNTAPTGQTQRYYTSEANMPGIVHKNSVTCFLIEQFF